MKQKKYHPEVNVGFIYIFSKDINSPLITEDSNFNFIQNCLAIGLENYYLIKQKKHEKVDREISTGADTISITSRLLPNYLWCRTGSSL